MTHRVEYRISDGDVWALLRCDESEGAPCRLICPEGCESWPCPHELVDAGYCNEIEFIGNAGPALEYREGGAETGVADGEVTIRWDGDMYVWSQDDTPADPNALLDWSQGRRP